jgi:soluble lytic murein transglycosylase-like protein
MRAFAPALTAQSDALWQSLARGEMTVGYSQSHRLRRLLGATVPVAGRHGHQARLRLGAFASIGIGPAEALVAHSRAPALDLKRARRLVISAPHLSDTELAATVHRLFGRSAVVHSSRPQQQRAVVSAFAQATIPASYLALYRAAATTCLGLPWTVLAGIGAVETGHGANTAVSPKGAVGPMQFLPSTFAAYAVDGDGDGYADINNPADAVYSAARYLCLWGAGRGGQALYDAIFAYNHADWYVREVVAYANAYA